MPTLRLHEKGQNSFSVDLHTFDEYHYVRLVDDCFILVFTLFALADTELLTQISLLLARSFVRSMRERNEILLPPFHSEYPIHQLVAR